MIFLTLNCQGLANPSKKLAIKRPIETLKPSIILLHETMTDGVKVIQELSKFMIEWEFSYFDAIGGSSGNISRWKRPPYTLSNSWAFPTSLQVALFSMDMGKEIYVLNAYGPYFDRVEYWDKFFNTQCVQSDLVVIGGDLNHIRGLEICEPATHMYCRSRYFIRKLEPTKLTPT